MSYSKPGTRFSLFIILGVMVATAPLGAQATTLTLTGSSLTFQPRTAADLDAGIITATGVVTFTVAAPAGQTLTRTTTVAIHSSSANLGGTKPLSDLEWRRGDLSTWTAITTSDVTVESRVINVGTSSNNPWSNTINFRLRTAWTGTGGTSMSTANYVITLSQ